MPKTRKTIQLKNLAKYDVLIEDGSSNSTYFQVTNLPSSFTGGRNSFLIAGSSALKSASSIQIEILDSAGITIFQNPVQKYVQGDARLISVEVTETTAVGFATIIILGQAITLPNGQPVPPDWQNSYNVRWIKQILIEPNLRNSSPLILENTPTIISEENRLYSVLTSSYTTASTPFTASLSPTLYSSFQIGYTIKAESPTVFSEDYVGGYITGSMIIDQVSASLYLPITDVLNTTTAFSTGQLITTTDGRTVDKLYLRSGSYTTPLFGSSSAIKTTAQLVYNTSSIKDNHIPVSYAKLRLVNLDTVSGEIFKFKVYSKVSTNLSDYKLVAEIPVTTSELLVTGSIRGDLPIGNFYVVPTASNWYSDRLETSSNAIYTISGSAAYYNSTVTSINPPITMSITDNVLLRSIRSEIPTFNNANYSGYLSASGYFIGNKKSVQLFPTTEYTLQFDAFYKKTIGAVNLTGVESKVDIYIVGVEGTKVIDNNPLGQKLGTLTLPAGAETYWYQDQELNFTPQLAIAGSVGIRFVVSNGFWYFSEISLKPASDILFAPDEAQILVPNTEYYNELLQHKIEFFDINSNSTDVSIESVPTFFTGSNIDLGTLP